MDSRTFDAVARTLGRSVDRRSALRGALAALFGAGVVRSGAGAVDCQTTGRLCGSGLRVCCADAVCDATTNRCRGLAGAVCKLSSQCASGLLCKGGVCVAAQVCRQMRESCVPTASGCCATMACDRAQLVCLTDLGYPCAANADCANGAVCRGGVCAGLGAAGEACDEDADCAGTLGCNTGEGKCRAPLNGACSTDAECGAGRACYGNVCIVPECPTIPCDDGRICWKGSCVTPLSCTDLPDVYGCYESAEGLRLSYIAGYRGPCDTSDECQTDSICTHPETIGYGLECVCTRNYYNFGTFFNGQRFCTLTLIDRAEGDQCRYGAECGRGMHCDNGTCRPMRDGECHHTYDCTDPEFAFDSDCCDGVCQKVRYGNQKNCGACGNSCDAGELCCNFMCIAVAPGVDTCP